MNTPNKRQWLPLRPRIFKREEENKLMLEQFLSDLNARYLYLAGLPETGSGRATEEVENVIGRFRAYQDGKASGHPGELPDWPDAFLVEQLLTRLMPVEEARAELARQLAALKAIDPNAHDGIEAEWTAASKDGDLSAARTFLIAAQRAVQWKNTQRWIIRQLGTLYASRLQLSFLAALALGIALIFTDATYGRAMDHASLSGIGFAAAAGLLGASFSAMVGQGQVVALDNIEEARSATSRQMIALRLGVGVAAALILYFFFEAGLVDGALFPELAQIGFGRVQPLGTEVGEIRAMVTTLTESGEGLAASMTTAGDSISAAIDAAKASGGQIDPATLEAVLVSMNELSTKIGGLNERSAVWSLPLGSLAPNADLSKLVVWSFAAGFVQTLVPSLLATVKPLDATK